MGKVKTIVEIGGFLHERRKYWLGPILLLLALIGLLVVVGESSGVGPFLYPFL